MGEKIVTTNFSLKLTFYCTKFHSSHHRSRDDYEANKALRSAMRVKRKAAKAQADLDGKLLKKSSLNISLLPENEADKTTAALLRMAPALTPGLAT